MNNKLERFSDDEIIKILHQSKSFKEAVESFGYSSNGSGGYTHLKNLLKKRNIDKPTYYIPMVDKLKNGIPKKIPLSEILVENSTYNSISRLKKRLVEEGVLEYKCTKCGNKGVWLNEKLVLQLEHKNGVNNDHRKKNLEFLCPNCHSQSKTYAGKNRKIIKKINYCECGAKITKNSKMCVKCRNNYVKIHNRKVVNRPTKEVLRNSVLREGYRATGAIYGVSDNTIRNWLK